MTILPIIMTTENLTQKPEVNNIERHNGTGIFCFELSTGMITVIGWEIGRYTAGIQRMQRAKKKTTNLSS